METFFSYRPWLQEEAGYRSGAIALSWPRAVAA